MFLSWNPSVAQLMGNDPHRRGWTWRRNTHDVAILVRSKLIAQYMYICNGYFMTLSANPQAYKYSRMRIGLTVQKAHTCTGFTLSACYYGNWWCQSLFHYIVSNVTVNYTIQLHIHLHGFVIIFQFAHNFKKIIHLLTHHYVLALILPILSD